jgi:hypothetical protein
VTDAYTTSDNIRIVIEAVEPVLAGQLGEFLQLFESVFLETRMVSESLNLLGLADETNPPLPSLLHGLENEFEHIWLDLPSWAREHRFRGHHEGLRLLRFSKNSPIELVTAGIPIGLAVAVIFSGGQVKLPGCEFRLPPLGVGIEALRQALGLTRPRGEFPKGIVDRGVVREP